VSEAHRNRAAQSQKQAGDPASYPDPPLDFPNNTGKFLMGLVPMNKFSITNPKIICFSVLM
jgi:hypothetical protein